ncbi:hypothetical protein D1872_304890 [compost metagenome]
MFVFALTHEDPSQQGIGVFSASSSTFTKGRIETLGDKSSVDGSCQLLGGLTCYQATADAGIA